MTAPVVVVSGPPGAGKTSVSRALADRFDLAVHLQTDVFYASIRRGLIAPWKPEAARQNEAVAMAAARSVGPYALAGYTTIVDGVVLPWALEMYRRELTRDGLAFHCAVLLPDVEEVVRRGLGRTEEHALDETVYREMHRQFVAAFDGRPEPFFPQTASVSETADAVISVLAL